MKKNWGWLRSKWILGFWSEGFRYKDSLEMNEKAMKEELKFLKLDTQEKQQIIDRLNKENKYVQPNVLSI